MQGVKISKIIKRGNKDDIASLFEMIYTDYYKLVFFVAFSYLKEEQSSEDITQDVFITFFEKCSDANWVSQIVNIKSYLCSCAKNAAIKEMKAREKHKEVENLDTLFLPNKECSDEFKLQIILDDIDSDSLKIVDDHIFIGLSFREIAQLTNSPINTVKSKYRRTIQKIRRKIKDE